MHIFNSFVFILFFCAKAFATDFDLSPELKNLDQKIDDNNMFLSQNSDFDYNLSKIRSEILSQKRLIDACLLREKSAIENLKFNSPLVDIKTNLPLLIEKKQIYQNEIQVHQDNYQFCLYLNKKLKRSEININMMSYHHHRQELVRRAPNILETIHVFWQQGVYTNIKSSDFINYLLHYSQAFKFVNMILLYALVLVVFRLLFYLKFKHFASISAPMIQILFALSIVIFTSPFIFNALSYDVSNDLSLYIEAIRKVRILKVVIFIVIYVYLKNIWDKRRNFDPVLIVMGLVANLGLLMISCQIYFLNLYPATQEILGLLLFWRYIFLLTLMPLIFLSVYFLRNHVLSFLVIDNFCYKVFKNFILKKVHFLNLLLIAIFILGLIGYLYLAIAAYFLVIILFCAISWFFIFLYFLNHLFSQLKNPESWIGKKMNQFIFIGQNYSFFELRFLKGLVLFGLFAAFLAIIWGKAFLPHTIFIQIYNFFFESQDSLTLNTKFIFIDIMTAIGLFMILNIFNRILASYFAKRLQKEEDNLEKYERVLYIFGIFINILICLKITQINFQDASIILGGLSFGLGIGLRDLIGSFIAGLILMFTSPLSKGQYVVIAEVRGFVRKISLLDTQIESFDKVFSRISNLKVLSSVVQNFSLSKTTPPRFHFTFIFSEIGKLEQYKKTILDILGKQEEIIMTGYLKPDFFILPSGNHANPKEMKLNVGYSIYHIELLQQSVSNLTLHFIQSFDKSDESIYLQASSGSNL